MRCERGFNSLRAAGAGLGNSDFAAEKSGSGVSLSTGDDGLPGPRFQGPEQWRLKRKSGWEVDPSLIDCSNCMRCDDACPADVPLSQTHNEARAECVENQMRKLSVEYCRHRVLANCRSGAWPGGNVPRLTDALANNRVLRAVGERLFGLTAERESPAFATETFGEWWETRGGAATSKARVRQRRRRGRRGTGLSRAVSRPKSRARPAGGRTVPGSRGRHGRGRDDSCSSISGTYGWKAKKYETFMTIGEEMGNAEGQTGMTKCPPCAM
ncbi:hypothetical protein [Halorientalis sp.]|uniref:hypothetical protein n=1 Tax=Halorientalis sp. TaxID=1931229 RepID=UPI0026188723|nr:hypothetical protein [Halorientalis sp.]